MKVIDLLKTKQTLSFEFFPPKTPEQEARLFEVIVELKAFNPDYVSVTYGALGTTREKTFFWVKEIKERFGMVPVAHLTCVAANRDEIRIQVEELLKIGVENILALRGDPPGIDKFTPPKDGLRFACELVLFIKKYFPQICLGVAGCPESHPESKTPEEDIRHLKEKVSAGADYIVTQLFFDNQHYFNFVERCRSAKILCPIIPGIMPITNYKSLRKMTEICGATIPANLLAKLKKNQDDAEAVKKIGIEQAVKQVKDLQKAGAAGLHFFVMNQAGPITQILKDLNVK